MIPVLLSISGFLSYRDPVEIDFTTFDLACIAGPNGAGKSSLLDSITWVLFGQARKRDDSIINSLSSEANVSLVFNYENNIYRVHRIKPREKTSILEFSILQKIEDLDFSDRLALLERIKEVDVWKTLSERTLRKTEQQIVNTLHMDYDTFINASFFLQGKADQFTQQSPGERKRILGNILGLEVWENYRKHAAELRKTVEKNIVHINGQLEEIYTELNQEKERTERLETLTQELERLKKQREAQERIVNNIRKIVTSITNEKQFVDALWKQIQSLQNELDATEEQLKQRKQERDSYNEIISKEEEIRDGYQKLLHTRDDLKKWEKIAEEFRDYDKQREPPNAEIQAEQAKLEQELRSLKADEAEAEQAQTAQNQFSETLKKLEKEISELDEKVKQKEELSKERDELLKKITTAQTENPRLRTEMDEIKDRIDRLERSDSPECPVCGQPLPTKERLALIAALQAEGKQLGNKFRANKSLISEYTADIRKLEQTLNQLKQFEVQLSDRRQKLARIETQIENHKQTIENWEKSGKPHMIEIQKKLETNSFALEARVKLAKIDAQLKEIGYDAAAHETVRKNEELLSNYEIEVSELDQAKAALKPLLREIDELEERLKTKQTQIDELQPKYESALLKLEEDESQAPDLEQAEKTLSEIKQSENQTRQELGAAQQKVDVLKDLKQRQKALDGDRENLAKQVEQYKRLEKAFGKNGVPALLIEQALPQIEAKANELLERLSDGNMSIQFITQAEYKDKKRNDQRETLDIRISDGVGKRDYEMYSGGEAFRINFAIRLALSEVLAQRAGARLQTLVIDEGFGSQDVMGRQRLVEAINMVSEDFAKILVITHIEELKEAFPTRIEVEKTPRGSVVHVFQ